MITRGAAREVGTCGRRRPEHRDQLVVDDLDDLLAGVRLSQHLGADGPLAHAADEVLDDLEVDVGLEQRQAHLAHGDIDVRLADPAAAGELAEGVAQAVAKGVEHGRLDRTPRFGLAAGRVGSAGGTRVLACRGEIGVYGPIPSAEQRPDEFLGVEREQVTIRPAPPRRTGPGPPSWPPRWRTTIPPLAVGSAW